MTKSKGVNRARFDWDDVAMELLTGNYADSRSDDLARAIGCSIGQLYRKANALGLKKNEAFLVSTHSGRIQRGRSDPRMQATQFQRGFTPWNKGMRGLEYEGRKPTQFKPGQRPHTWVPVGSYRVVGGNLERKVNDLPGPNHVRWHPVHRLVWEAANGPVPKGCVCVFKPGRHTAVLEEITLDRMEVITRAENLLRNHPRYRYPELGRLVQLKGAITRQVNRINREAQERAKEKS